MTLDEIYISPFTARRVYSEDGVVSWIPLKRNLEPTGIARLDFIFRSFSEGNYTVCRWGGEEFCFFMPGKNIDEAWNVMFALCEAVRKMQISFEGNEFSITITIGLEENDFRSSIDRILEKADKKLYMGKVAGRNRVVM